MKDKTGRPLAASTDKSTGYDLDGKRIFIPPGYIKEGMINETFVEEAKAPHVFNNGTEYGLYGLGTYGRCRYAPPVPGIYGYNSYGNASYG